MPAVTEDDVQIAARRIVGGGLQLDDLSWDFCGAAQSARFAARRLQQGTQRCGRVALTLEQPDLEPDATLAIGKRVELCICADGLGTRRREAGSWIEKAEAEDRVARLNLLLLGW